MKILTAARRYTSLSLMVTGYYVRVQRQRYTRIIVYKKQVC